MQRETKQSISVLALVFAIFAFAGYGYAATANYTNTSNIYNYSIFNNSGITYNGTYLYNYYNNDTFQSIGYDILANILYFEYHNVSFSSTGFEHNNSTIYNNYNNSIIDNINQLNSTITNYYNYTNYDHASLQNLSYSASGHTGFESSAHASTTYETISNVGALHTAYFIHGHSPPYGMPLGNGEQVSYLDLSNLPNLSEKLNKSGDTMTGILNMSDKFQILNNGKLLGSTGALDTGGISYQFYTVGKVYNNSNYVIENGSYSDRMGFQMQTQVSSSIMQERTFFYNSSSGTAKEIRRMNINNATGTGDLTYYNLNLTVSSLAGSGYAYACLDSSGKFIRSSVQCDLI